MIAPGEEDFQRVKAAVDSWAAEVLEVRSALSQKLFIEMDTTRPVFRLNRARPIAPVVSESSVPYGAVLDAQSRARSVEDENRRLVSEIEFAREHLHERNRLATEKVEQAEELSRALGRMRIELDEAIETLRSKDWALTQIKNENELLRGDGNAQVLSQVVPLDDYDALVASHMGLRDEVAALQQRIIQRDHELMAAQAQLTAAQAELSVWESAGPVSRGGMAKLAGVLADRSAALEEIEDTALGQKYLIGALRQELDAVRATLDSRELDHDRLAEALRSELECLRGLSAERDFVIGHQSETLETVSEREQGLDADLSAAKEAAETFRRRAELAVEEREALARDLQLLRAKLAEREGEVWRLRAAPAPSAPSGIPGLAQLEAALAARDAELARARERITFLRSTAAGRSDGASPDSAPSDVLPPNPTTGPGGDPAAMDLDGLQINSALQREVERALSHRFPWPLAMTIVGLAGFGLLVLGLFALALSQH